MRPMLSPPPDNSPLGPGESGALSHSVATQVFNPSRASPVEGTSQTSSRLFAPPLAPLQWLTVLNRRRRHRPSRARGPPSCDPGRCARRRLRGCSRGTRAARSEPLTGFPMRRRVALVLAAVLLAGAAVLPPTGCHSPRRRLLVAFGALDGGLRGLVARAVARPRRWSARPVLRASRSSRRSSRSAPRPTASLATVVVVVGLTASHAVWTAVRLRDRRRSGHPLCRRPARLPGDVLERRGGDGARSDSGRRSRSRARRELHPAIRALRARRRDGDARALARDTEQGRRRRARAAPRSSSSPSRRAAAAARAGAHRSRARRVRSRTR